MQSGHRIQFRIQVLECIDLRTPKSEICESPCLDKVMAQVGITNRRVSLVISRPHLSSSGAYWFGIDLEWGTYVLMSFGQEHGVI
jgi:hypothetical protein